MHTAYYNSRGCTLEEFFFNPRGSVRGVSQESVFPFCILTHTFTNLACSHTDTHLHAKPLTALPYCWAFFSSIQLSMSSDRLGSCICRYFEHQGRGIWYRLHWICSVTPCLYIPTSTTYKGIKLFGTRIASTMQKLKTFFGMLWNAEYYRGKYTK